MDDPYNPPEAVAERAALTVPSLVSADEDTAVLQGPNGTGEPVSAGGRVGAWRLLAVLAEDGQVVLEHRGRRWGCLVFLSPAGIEREIALAVGDPRLIPPWSEAPSAERLARILASATDPLAGREPAWESLAAELPELADSVPISTEEAPTKGLIDPLGRVGLLGPGQGVRPLQHVLFDPAEHVAGDPAPSRAMRGLLGEHLPAVHYAFVDDGACWEILAFAPVGNADRTRVALVEDGRWRCFLVEETASELPVAAFLTELARLDAHWRERLAPSMRLALPEARPARSALTGLVRTATVWVGSHPKYGLGAYAEAMHDGFPPTVLWQVAVETEWGLLDAARERLSCWLGRFVGDDGQFRYYGPAVSEYGQMLCLAERFAEVADDAGWLESHAKPLAAIAGHLLGLREEALRQPEPETRGLLYGVAEADTRESRAFYLSGSAWAARGLEAASRTLSRTARHGDLAHRCAEESDGLLTDVRRVAEACAIAGDPAFVPPHPGVREPFGSLTDGELASYTNYRYWPELLSSSVLPPELADSIERYRSLHGGELAGTIRFLGHLDDWPLAHLAYHWLATDATDRALLAFYGHLALHEMPGTYCSYEQVQIAAAGQHRLGVADLCVPVQLTTALLLKWMLVWEDRPADELWLLRAVPRRWLAPGEGLRVEGAPTRWGKLSFRAAVERDLVRVEIDPPARCPGSVVVRLRRPDGACPRDVRADGRAVPFDAGLEAVRVPRGTRRVEARYGG